MSWGAVVGGGAAVLGGVLGSRSAGKAQDAQNRANAEALAEQRRQFDLNFSRQEPYHLAGVGAVNELRNMRFEAPTGESVLNDPGYAFGLSEGREALENSAAARGGLFSGNTAKNLLKYGTDYGTTKFNDAFERQRSTFNTNSGNLFNLANIGTGAAAQLQNAGANFADATGNIGQRGADAAGGAAVARGNIWSDVINQGVSIGNRNNWWQNPTNTGGGGAGGFNYTPNYDGSSPGGAGFGYADGGPVMLVEVEPGRFEPKVGSRSARRGGTGGGMSRENVARSVTAPAPAKKTGMGALPVNPVTNPGGLRRVQVEEAERYNDGGPVMEMRDGRMVPKVGTRSPRPGARGTGGGMSREQVLAALTAAQAASAPPAGRTGMGALPVNPVTNPGGLRKVQMEQAEGYKDGGPVMKKGKKGKAKCYADGGGVRKNYMGGGKVAGPGGPRDDAIPAWLSNGEHVVDAASVNAIGGGDNLRGQQALNQVRALLRGG